METNWFTKFLFAWAAGATCMIALPFITGWGLSRIAQLPDSVHSLAGMMFFLPLIGFMHMMLLTAIIAAVCGSLARDTRKSVIAAAAVNLGIVLTFIVLDSGMLPSINIGLH